MQGRVLTGRYVACHAAELLTHPLMLVDWHARIITPSACPPPPPLPQVHLAMALRRRESYMDSQAATIKLTCQYRVSDKRVSDTVTLTLILYLLSMVSACIAMYALCILLV